MVYFQFDHDFTIDERFILRHGVEQTDFSILNNIEDYDINITFKRKFSNPYEQLKI